MSFFFGNWNNAAGAVLKPSSTAEDDDDQDLSGDIESTDGSAEDCIEKKTDDDDFQSVNSEFMENSGQSKVLTHTASHPPIDVEHLFALVVDGETAILQLLAGMDVVLVFGKTGVGKTFFIHLIHGKKACVRLDKGVKTYLFTDNGNLADFEIGYGHKSTTRLLRVYVDAATGMCFVDLPGFRDTHDHHVDIATSAWIKKIAEVCKSLRFVLMVQWATLEDDRGAPFRELLEMFSTLVNGNLTAVYKSLLVLITHMSDHGDEKDEKKTCMPLIQKKIAGILKETNQEGAKKFMELLCSFIDNKTGRVRVLNPLTTDVAKLKEFMHTKVKGFTNAVDTLRFSVNKDVDYALSNAVDELATSVQEGLFSAIPEKQQSLARTLQHFHTLKRMINTPLVAQKFSKSMQSVQERYKSFQAEAAKSIERIAVDQTTIKPLCFEEVDGILRKFNRIAELESILRQYLGKDYALEQANRIDRLVFDLRTKHFLLVIDTLTRLHLQPDGIAVMTQLGNLQNLTVLRERMPTAISSFHAEKPLPNLFERVAELLASIAASPDTFRSKNTLGLRPHIATEIEYQETARTIALLSYNDIARHVSEYIQDVTEDAKVPMKRDVLGIESLVQVTSGVLKLKSLLRGLEPEHASVHGIALECGVVDAVDKKLARLLEEEFKNLEDKLFSAESVHLFEAFASKLALFQSDERLRKVFRAASTILTKRNASVGAAVMTELSSRVPVLRKCIESGCGSEMRDQLSPLLQLARVLTASIAGFAEVQTEISDAASSIRTIVKRREYDMLQPLQPFFVSLTELTSSCLSNPGTLVQYLQEKGFIDEMDCISASLFVTPTLLEGCPFLSTEGKAEVMVILEAQQTAARKHVPPYNESYFNTLKSAEAFDWFYAASGEERDGRWLRKKVLAAYMCRLTTLKNAVEELDPLCQDLLLTHINEMIILKNLFPLEDVFSSALLDRLCTKIQAFAKNVAASCRGVTSITLCASAFPFEKVELMMALKAKYRAVPEWGNLLSSFLDAVDEDVTIALTSFIQKPLMTQNDAMALDTHFLASVAVCEEKLKACPMVRRYTLALGNFDGEGNSLQQILQRSVLALIQRLNITICSEVADVADAEAQLELLQRYVPLDSWLGGIGVATAHQRLVTQLSSLHSAADRQIKEQISAMDFTGLPEVLSKLVQPPVTEQKTKKFNDVMSLVAPVVQALIRNAFDSLADGEQLARYMQQLEQIQASVRGAEECNGSSRDYLREYSLLQCDKPIDLREVTKELIKQATLQVTKQIEILDGAKPSEVQLTVTTASNGMKYVDAMKGFVNDIVVNELLSSVKRKVLDYLQWDGETQPNASSLGALFVELMQRLTNEEPLTKEFGMSSLTSCLDQLQRLSEIALPRPLDTIAKYHRWREIINTHLSRLCDGAYSKAIEEESFSTNLGLLKYVESHLAGEFRKHYEGYDRLIIQIEELQIQLESYNKSMVTSFDTQENCGAIARNLDRLKRLHDNEEYADAFYYTFSTKKPTKKRVTEYTRHIGHFQQMVDELRGDALREFSKENYELGCMLSYAVMNAKKYLSKHLRVQTEEVMRQVESKFQAVQESLTMGIGEKNISLIISHFPKLLTLRLCVNSLGLPAQKGAIGNCSVLHDMLANLIVNVQVTFRKCVESFQFSEVRASVDEMDKIRGFLSLPETTRYFTHYKDDSSLHTLRKVVEKFETPEAVQVYLDDTHVRMQKTVEDALIKGEYFKLKAVNDGLLTYYLIDDAAREKSRIDGTAKAVHEKIKGHLEMLRKRIDHYFDEKDWLKLNSTIKTLQAVEAALEGVSGYADIVVLRNVQASLDAGLTSSGDKAIQLVGNGVGDSLQLVKDFSLELIEIGKIYEQVQYVYKLAETQLQRVLNHCNQLRGPSFMFRLGIALEKGEVFQADPDPDTAIRIGRKIVNDFHHFKDVATLVWNSRVTQHGVDQNLSELKSFRYDSATKTSPEVAIQSDLLRAAWTVYDSTYKELREKYIKEPHKIHEIVEQALNIATPVKPCSISRWQSVDKTVVPLLLAHIFAYYTVNKCGDSFNTLEPDPDTDLNAILVSPHNIQVITVLHLLGCANPSEILENHLMQIRTGEGKSIILGALATIFGLLDFNVQCICYSEYLSERDHSDFKQIFEAFQCSDSIEYSKITTFAEKSIAKKGNIRQLTSELILGSAETASAESKRKSEKETVVLVDEVDVFFGEDFYGKTYNQVVVLSTPEISAIIKMIWKERMNNPSLPMIAKSAEYQALIAAHSEWKFLFDTEIRQMCVQVNQFNQPAYHYDPVQHRIGYKDHDTISYKLSYGYRTVFAYLQEKDEQHLHMLVSCGQFSYANINPTAILGVSGTLNALTKSEKEAMSRYNIRLCSVAPSVYGENDVAFDHAGRGILVATTRSEWFKCITDEINAHSHTQDASRQRHQAVIVVFESEERLEQFRTSDYFSKIVDKSVNILTERTPKSERDHMVKQAATGGQVTLVTKVFGRGTDFISRDQQLNEKGGVVILQPFFSETLSEEIQVKGRTARQGQKGMLRMVLLMKDDPVEDALGNKLPRPDTLEHFGITPEEFNKEQHGDRYTFLSTKRTQKNQKQAKAIEIALEKASGKDGHTHAYFDALLIGARARAIELFKENYALFKKGVESRQSQDRQSMHIIFLLDDSGSMQGGPFQELTHAYQSFVKQRKSNPQGCKDVVSVIMFNGAARCIAKMVPLDQHPALNYLGGGTSFTPAFNEGYNCLQADTTSAHNPVLILMTDGGCGDRVTSLQTLTAIDQAFRDKGLQVHLVAFGNGADMNYLKQLKAVCTEGHVHKAGVGELVTTFVGIEQSLMVPEHWS